MHDRQIVQCPMDGIPRPCYHNAPHGRLAGLGHGRLAAGQGEASGRVGTPAPGRQKSLSGSCLAQLLLSPRSLPHRRSQNRSLTSRLRRIRLKKCTAPLGQCDDRCLRFSFMPPRVSRGVLNPGAEGGWFDQGEGRPAVDRPPEWCHRDKRCHRV